MNIKPIKNDKDYEATLKMVDQLWNAEPDTDDGDKLDILVTLIEKYEEEHFHIESPDPIEAIKFVMEQNNMERSELEKILTKSRTSEFLNKKRKLTLPAIRKIHDFLHIPTEILIKDYKIKPYHKTTHQ